MADICERDGTHSGKLHEWAFPIYGNAPIHEVKLPMCEGHAAEFTLMPPLPMVGNQCNCRICAN